VTGLGAMVLKVRYTRHAGAGRGGFLARARGDMMAEVIEREGVMFRHLFAVVVLSAALAPLAAAPAPLSRRAKPGPPTEVVVEVVGGLERIEVTFGTKEVQIAPDERWPENLVACLQRIREVSPSARRLIFRCDDAELTPSQYVCLRRLCVQARYHEVHGQYRRWSR